MHVNSVAHAEQVSTAGIFYSEYINSFTESNVIRVYQANNTIYFKSAAVFFSYLSEVQLYVFMLRY